MTAAATATVTVKVVMDDALHKSAMSSANSGSGNLNIGGQVRVIGRFVERFGLAYPCH